MTVLVVGSAHLDICIRPHTEPDFSELGADIPSIAQFAVGGTAFNIAKNLALLGRDAALYTHLRAGSPTSTLILDACCDANIDTKYIQHDETLQESCFVAILKKENVRTAFTSTSIETATLHTTLLEKAISSACVVVIDCNLINAQIHQIFAICRKYKRPIVISGTSSAKSRRYLSDDIVSTSSRCSLVSMNMDEAWTITPHISTLLSKNDHNTILELFHSENLIVSWDVSGYFIVNCSGVFFVEPFGLSPEGCNSTLGAGDALLSAYCANIKDHRTIDLDKSLECARTLIQRTLFEITATTP
mgnify:CR=1 FL=1